MDVEVEVEELGCGLAGTVFSGSSAGVDLGSG